MQPAGLAGENRSELPKTRLSILARAYEICALLLLENKAGGVQMLWKLFKSKAGNFSITTAFLMAPMVGMAGLAVDFANALMMKEQVQAAADAAALASISEKSALVASSLQMGDGTVASASATMAADGSLAVGNSDVLKLFVAELGSHPGYHILSVDTSIIKSGKTLKSVFNYVAEVPTNLSRAFGKNTITFRGTATAEFATQTFRDFYLLLDNTPSMGVGATPADVSKMVANTSDKCAFACHINNNGVESSSDYYHLAKRLGVTTRIDVLALATASLMDTATARRNTVDQYRMAIYTFGTKAEDTRLLEIQTPTADLALAKSKATNVQLMTIPYQGYNNDQQTSFDTALTQIKAKMGTQGNGNTSTSPEKVLFFVADGVGDSYKPGTCTKATTGGRCQEPIDIKFCDAVKAQNFKIAVLYTTYLPLTTNAWYNSWIAPFQNDIATRMRSCASDGLFFEVSPTQGISDAMNALFLRIINTPRLTG